MQTSIDDNPDSVARTANGRGRAFRRRKIGDGVKSTVASVAAEQDTGTRTDISGGTSVLDTTVSFAALVAEGSGSTDPENGKSATSALAQSMMARCCDKKSQPRMSSWEHEESTKSSTTYTAPSMTTLAVHAACGATCCVLAVRSSMPDSGVVTLCSFLQSFSSMTETAAPVSISAIAAVPSTITSNKLRGDCAGLVEVAKLAVRACGTAAASFPRWATGDDVRAKASDDVGRVIDGWRKDVAVAAKSLGWNAWH